MSLWPKTLFGRVALIVCGGLAIAHGLTLCIILRERADQGMAMMLAYVGRDVATSVAVLDRVPPAERAAWLPRLARQNYHYALGPVTPGQPSRHPLALPMAEVVAAEIGASRVGHVQQGGSPGTVNGMVMPMRLMDGTPLSLELIPPRLMVSRTTLVLLMLQLTALLIAAWLAVRLAVKPMSRLADAADALKPGAGQLALDETGPQEVAQAAKAFNAMQQRIDAHLRERMQLLAAISHDLQTPITRMRLRADQLTDEGLRDKWLADLEGMQGLVEEGLAYARTAQATQEPQRAIDLHALLDGLVCDAQDAGHDVTLVGQLEAPLVTRVQALRRILTNLMDNAVKFGGSAQLVVSSTAHHVHIAVSDQGPGIPESELDAVCQPFYRLDASRNRDTGGTGLGLAIADQLTQALSGQLTLQNRPQGGLQATLSLPR
jgi:signal transduction histidine kinase